MCIRDSCGPALPTPELADVSTRRYVCQCLVHFLLHNTPERTKKSQLDLSPVSSEAISQMVRNPVSVRTARNSLIDVMCYPYVVTSGKGLTPVESM